MRKFFIVITLSFPWLCGNAFVLFDQENILQIIEMYQEMKENTQIFQQLGDNSASANMQSSAAVIDAVNNGNANIITRISQAKTDIYNGKLSQKSASVDLCGLYARSYDLNNQLCEAADEVIISALNYNKDTHDRFARDEYVSQLQSQQQVVQAVENQEVLTKKYYPKPAEERSNRFKIRAVQNELASSVTSFAINKRNAKKNILESLTETVDETYSSDAIEQINSQNKYQNIRQKAVNIALMNFIYLEMYKTMKEKELMLAAQLKNIRNSKQ